MNSETVVSMDGTEIGYTVVGKGPGLVIVHGNASSSVDFASVAVSLGEGFTVYSIDRRGRGLSGPQGPDYTMAKECDDIDAVVEKTASPYLFAHSYGALAVLEMLRTRDVSGLRKVALYEPPVLAKDRLAKLMPLFDAAMSKGDHARAYLELVNGLDVLHGFTSQQFEWYLENQLKPSADWPRVVQLMEATQKEALAASKFSLGSWVFHGSSEVLLLTGDESPGFLHDSVDLLKDKLPGAKIVVLRGQGHTAQSEDPGQLVRILRNFFDGENAGSVSQP
jgi:pimeloyl-ACP methyl ester carboxylesterase